MSKIKIQAFGIVAEKMGLQQTMLSDLDDTDALKVKLESEFPDLKLVRYAIAYNRKLIHENIAFTGDCEIALLPPYSGG
ncbi:MAG: molybdopterin synthase sulfur carrier subunit [Saprospiraceae bacterium]|nr:molybdopterin synthase sulfur carrier subunit [Saprospiraceae bacterium]